MRPTAGRPLVRAEQHLRVRLRRPSGQVVVRRSPLSDRYEAVAAVNGKISPPPSEVLKTAEMLLLSARLVVVIGAPLVAWFPFVPALIWRGLIC